MSTAIQPAPTSEASTSIPENQSVLGETKRPAKIEDIDAEIGRLSRHINACNYQLITMIREFDERGGWLKWGFTDAVAWLRWRCEYSANTARDKLRVAHALKSLPVLSKAFESGQLSYSKVRSLTRIATVENESELKEQAESLSASKVEAMCRQRLNTRKSATDGANRSHSNRSLRLWRSEETGMMTVAIDLTEEDGRLFEKAIEKAARQLSAEVEHVPDALQHEKDSWHSLQADAAMLVVREYLSGECSAAGSSNKASATSSADLYQVVVHVDESALVAGGENEDPHSTASSEIPVETVRRLCCDSSVVPIVENDKGEPLRVGRKVRTITTAVRRALWSRDEGCAFPGCHCKRFVDAHHIKHWADGGGSGLDNLVLLCSKHHRMVHEGRYSIETAQSDQLIFRRPDGRVVPACGYHLDDWLDEDIGEIGDGGAELDAAHQNSREVSET